MVCYASEVHNLLFESTVVQEGKFFFVACLPSRSFCVVAVFLSCGKWVTSREQSRNGLSCYEGKEVQRKTVLSYSNGLRAHSHIVPWPRKVS